MDTEQIQQRMRLRRAAIDEKLDLLTIETRATRRNSLRVLGALALAAATAVVWTRRRRKRRRALIRRIAPPLATQPRHGRDSSMTRV